MSDTVEQTLRTMIEKREEAIRDFEVVIKSQVEKYADEPLVLSQAIGYYAGKVTEWHAEIKLLRSVLVNAGLANRG